MNAQAAAPVGNRPEIDTTRYLCASAFLVGAAFQRAVRQLLIDNVHAIAPNPGVDLALVAGVCDHAARRDLRYDLVLGLTGIVATLLMMTEDPLTIGLGVVVFIAIGCVAFARDAWAKALAKQFFRREQFDPAAVAARFPPLTKVSRAFAQPSRQNLLVYSGFSPFVGSGLDLGGWSFVVDASKPKEQLGVVSTVQPFTLADIYTRLHDEIDDLKFPTLAITDVLVVSGAEIADLPWVMPSTTPGRPSADVDAQTMSQFTNQSSHRARYYKCIRVVDWGSELAVTHYLRLSLSDTNLFVELSKFLLMPLKPEYRKVDELLTPSFLKKFATFTAYVAFSWVLALGAVMALLNRIGVWRTERRQRKAWRRAIKENPMFNYGAQDSLRERLASKFYVHYFQKLDTEMYLKFIEKRVLDSIIDFLDERGVDTTDMRTRQTVLANSGVIVQGTMQAGAVAVGPQSQATAVTNAAAAVMNTAKSAVRWTAAKGNP